LYRVYKTFNNGSLIDVYKKGKGFNKKQIKDNILGNKNEVDLVFEKKDILNKIFEDIGFLETDQYIVEELQNQLKETRKILDNSGINIDKKELIISSLNNDIKNCLFDKIKLERKIEEYYKPILYVEDTYDQIYKIAYLRLKNIHCSEDNFELKFKEQAMFQVFSKKSAKDLRKWLDTVDITDQKDKKIIGLFDFDSAFAEFNGLHKKKMV